MKVILDKRNSLSSKPLNLNVKRNNYNQIKKQNFTSRRQSSTSDKLNNNDKKENNINSEEENFSLLIKIIAYYQKGEFSPLLKLIDSTDLPYDSFFYWKFMYIKILSYQEIIQYKIYKYYKEKNLNKINKYFIIFIKYIQEIINNINYINPSINFNNQNDFIRERRASFLILKKREIKKKQKYALEKNKIKKVIPEMIETLITHLLNYCYFAARYCIYKKDIYESITFLSLGMRLINKCLLFATSPDTLLSTCHICIILSSLLIIEKNFSTAKNFIIFTLIICYKALDLRLNHDNERNMNYFLYIKLDSNDEIFLNKIYFLLSIAYYYFGICYENEDNITRAIGLYQQSKYFYNKITEQNQEDSDFDLFLDNIINRLLFREKLVSFIKQEEKNIKIIKEVVKMPKVLYEKFEIDINKNKEKKYEKVKNFIENLKIKELDCDEPELLNNAKGESFSQKVAIPTKNIHILNYFLSNKFNDYLNENDKFDFYNLSLESRIKIQREIKNIKREELEKYLQIKNKNVKVKVNEEINYNKSKNRIHRNTINNNTFFNNFKSNNNNIFSNKKNNLLNKNFSNENIKRNKITFLNINSSNDIKKEKANEFSRKMSLQNIPIMNLNINNDLGSIQNSLLNKTTNSSYKINSYSFADFKTKKNIGKDYLDFSESPIKINKTKKNLLSLNISPFSEKYNTPKNLKTISSNNNIHFHNSLKRNKNKIINKKQFLTELLSYLGQDKYLNKNTRKNNNFKSNLKIKKMLKSKSQKFTFNKNIFNKKLMLKKII